MPRKLLDLPQPDYFCVDSLRLCVAELDPDASGYAGVHRCPECGNMVYDLAASKEKQKTRKFPFSIIRETWRGLHLFTTELTGRRLFCTRQVVMLAHDERLTNFHFVPVDDRDAAEHPGLSYLSDDFKI